MGEHHVHERLRERTKLGAVGLREIAQVGEFARHYEAATDRGRGYSGEACSGRAAGASSRQPRSLAPGSGRCWRTVARRHAPRPRPTSRPCSSGAGRGRRSRGRNSRQTFGLSPRSIRLSISAWTTAAFSVAPSTRPSGCLWPSPSMPRAATSTRSLPICRPSIWMTKRSSWDRSDAIHSGLDQLLPWNWAAAMERRKVAA
jgi:hypothetical protein